MDGRASLLAPRVARADPNTLDTTGDLPPYWTLRCELTTLSRAGRVLANAWQIQTQT
ncbi:hypothetical protein GCM10009646_04640 [Streptomyces aureus]